MCGVASIVRRGGDSVDPSDLARMCSAIAHRGPDGAGYALLDKGRVGLGHVRLSIVDLASGDQPLYNEDYSIAAVCNGELYDYQDLRNDLSKRGHQFRTSSDSELLVHLYEEYGTELFQHLHGEFAFLLWDASKRRLIAGRDPCGIKPLYYSSTPSEIVFASEVKAIYALNRVERALCTRYLTGPALGIYREELTPFANVHPVRPGHFLVIEADGSQRECRHFCQTYEPRMDMTFAEAKAAVRDRLNKAVKRRLAADVPVHAYLSGGLDSTIICGLMAQFGTRFTCFNVGFPDSPYDESHKARAVAAHFGQQFETVPCTPQLIAENISAAVFATEMPLNNYNAVAKMVLSRYVRSRGVKVCLTGEGSDELFGGYPYFKLEAIWRLLAAGGADAAKGRELHRRFRTMEVRSEGLLWDASDRWKRATSMFGYPSFFNLRARDAGRCIRAFFDTGRLGLTPDDMPDALLRTSMPKERLQGLDPFNTSRLLTLNQLYNIVIPSLGDRVEMAHSLECRPPFLDRDLMELMGIIPPAYFIDLENLREKNLLREATADLLPPSFQTEHKHPFLAPTWSSFGKTRLGRDLFGEFLSGQTTREVGVFRPLAVTLARLALNWLPLPRGLGRKLDALLGTILTTHLLHHSFVKNRIVCDPMFPMVDRSPQRLDGKRHAA
ncbi:MAG: asparagine synthase (glutamine-hydrolyzing) [Gemmataceae bacterium]|nr:asparagine synthase (glutamine-hydrolyzing) [Gemmataceae bacterium]